MYFQISIQYSNYQLYRQVTRWLWLKYNWQNYGNPVDIIREIHLINRGNTLRNVFDEDGGFEFETELRNSWLLWEVSEGWWVGERISQCEIGHWWLQQILRLKLVTFLLWQFRQKCHLYLLMCSLFFNVYLFSNW